MSDITKYLDGLNYTITAEEKCLMDIFAEAWEYCRGRDCSDCEYHGEGNERGKMLICISYQYAKRIIAAGYRNVTPPAECKDDELITAAFGVYPSTLTDREKHIVVLRQGLSNGIKLTFEDIGREYGVTSERIRQLEKNAMGKLAALKVLTADVAPVVYGRWFKFKETDSCYVHMRCSVCSAYWSDPSHADHFRYCPNCGAKMEGEE